MLTRSSRSESRKGNVGEDLPLEVEGECALCGTPLKLVLGKRVDEKRWVLAEKVKCSHCDLFLCAALKDGYGRYWGRRKIRND